MRFHELIEGRDAPLYRGFKEPKHFAMAISEDRLVGSTSQRYWDDGRRRKDNEPDYRTSNWMKGLSFTRDIKFAMRWGSVVIEVDQARLAQRNKIMPLNWGFSIPDHPMMPQHHKREREEFLITHMGDRYLGDDGEFDHQKFHQPQGEVKGLASFLTGIWIEKHLATARYLQDELIAGGYSIEQILSHPKFRGYYDLDRDNVWMVDPSTVTPIIHSKAA